MIDSGNVLIVLSIYFFYNKMLTRIIMSEMIDIPITLI